MTGTMDDPQVQLTRQGALDFATKVGPGGKQRKKLSGEIDDALGEGAGEQVLDVLDGIFGGRGRR